MSNELITIEAKLRDSFGKIYAKKLRKEGLIPANLLEKGKATSLMLDPKWLGVAYKKSKSFNMSLNGEVKAVKIHEVQVHPTKRIPLHVDLMYV